jgi:hypothetical protein
MSGAELFVSRPVRLRRLGKTVVLIAMVLAMLAVISSCSWMGDDAVASPDSGSGVAQVARFTEFGSLSSGPSQATFILRWGSAAVLAVLVGYGLFRRHEQDERRRYWPQVPGRVVAERSQGYGAGGDSTYDSIVLFKTLDGSEITGSPRGGVYLGMPVVGRTVPVWYDPRDPNLFEARIYALDRAGSLPLLSAAFPLVMFAVSFLT